MTDFSQSNWSRTDFSRNYLEKADIYIVERRRMFGILLSFAEQFLPAKGRTRLFDLGCGDGVLTEELLKVGGFLSATLLDGSEDMLAKARQRLGSRGDFRYVRASFQDLLEREVLSERYACVVSSMAIHHLTLNEKIQLFRKVHTSLEEGGFFVNFDVVLHPTEALDQWYMKLWLDWMDEKKASLGIEGEPSGEVIKRYKELGENKPDTLDSQLTALIDTGFREVDCFYKYGIFTVYGGRK